MKLIQQARNKWKEWRVSTALNILDKYEIQYFLKPKSEIQDVIDGLILQVQKKFGDQTGEFKRHQVLRTALNALPNVPEREIALAIELGIRNV